MKPSNKISILFSVVAVVINSFVVAPVLAQATYPQPSLDKMSKLTSPSSEKLFKPLLNPEGECADDITYFPFPGFPDVTKHDAQCFALRQLVSAGIISGYGDGTFGPYNHVTRGQFAKIIMLTFADRYPIHPIPTAATFADVPVGSTFFAYIEAATRHGLMSGRDGNPTVLDNCGTNPNQYENSLLDYFKWCDNINRGQMSKPLAQAANFNNNVAGRSSFSDVPSTHTFYTYIERLQMNGALEELPLHMPGRPACGTAGVKPCYQPNIEVVRIDAVQLVVLARTKYYEYTQGGTFGQAFPRRLTEINEEGGHDGVQAFVSTPYSNIPAGTFLAGPLGVADAVNGHFIEAGPYRRCTSTGDGPTACANHPYASSRTARICLDPNNNEIPCDDEADIDQTFPLMSLTSYEYRSYYVSNYDEWWAEYFNTSTKEWTRVITVTEMGTDRMREVFGAAETSSHLLASESTHITNARSHSPGGSWSGWCYDAGIIAPKMFNSYFSTCPPPGVENFSWFAKYTP